MADVLISAQPVPDRLRPLFWDCRFTDLNWREHTDFIVRRALSLGDWETVQWLRKFLGDAAIRAWLIEQRGRGLTPQQIRYWELMLDLPAPAVAEWLAEAQNSLWQQRTFS